MMDRSWNRRNQWSWGWTIGLCELIEAYGLLFIIVGIFVFGMALGIFLLDLGGPLTWEDLVASWYLPTLAISAGSIALGAWFARAARRDSPPARDRRPIKKTEGQWSSENDLEW